MSGVLVLRRGTVASVERGGPAAELTVEVDGRPRPAIAYLYMSRQRAVAFTRAPIG